MTARVTLSWDDPEDAAEFLRLRGELRGQGWVTDPAGVALQELVAASEVVKDSTEEGHGDA
jgi:hypothetical protein